MTIWVPRSGWGAKPAKSRTLFHTPSLKGMVIHYTAMNDDEQANHENCPGRVRNIQNYHQSTEYTDIAYNFVVCKHGYIFEGRGWGVKSGANGTTAANDNYHASVFLGDDTENRDDVTDLGRLAFKDLIIEGRKKWSYAQEVRPHSFFKATSCPGNDLRNWITAGLPTIGEEEKMLTAEQDIILRDIHRFAAEVKDGRHLFTEAQVEKIALAVMAKFGTSADAAMVKEAVKQAQREGTG